LKLTSRDNILKLMKRLDKEEEKIIIEKAKKDIKHFEALFEAYFDKLYGYVAYLTGDQTLAEDITSQAFEKAIINIDKFEWRGYSFSAWLYRIARNLIYDNSRKQQNISLDNLGEFVTINDDNFEEIVSNSINLDNLRVAINNLKPDQKEIILLRYIQEYSIKETCQITGRSVDSVKSLSKRALQTLKEIMKN